MLGKVFWSDGLAALSGSERWELEERLHALERKEFVRREARSAVAGAAQYAFLHLLIRDVAYGQLPRAARADRHLRAAAWIETLGGDRSEDRAEMLAHHYLCVLEHGRAGGVEPDLAARACAALADAGARASALSAYAAADRYYEAALELSDDPYLGLAYGRSIAIGGSSFTEGKAEPVLARAVPELLALGDAPAAAEGEMLLGTAEWERGRRDAAGARFERAVALVADAPVSQAKVFVLSEAARFEFLAGRAEAAIRLCEEVLPMVEELGLDSRVPGLQITIGSSRTTLGDREGLALLERAIALADDVNLSAAIRGRTNLASHLVELGEVERGREIHAEGLRVAERVGLPLQVAWLRAELGVDAVLLGEWEPAATILDDFLRACEGRPHYMEPGGRVARAVMRLARGDVTGAHEDAERALAFARGAKDPQVLLAGSRVRAGGRARGRAGPASLGARGRADRALHSGAADGHPRRALDGPVRIRAPCARPQRGVPRDGAAPRSVHAVARGGDRGCRGRSRTGGGDPRRNRGATRRGVRPHLRRRGARRRRPPARGRRCSSRLRSRSAVGYGPTRGRGAPRQCSPQPASPSRSGGTPPSACPTPARPRCRRRPPDGRRDPWRRGWTLRSRRAGRSRRSSRSAGRPGARHRP